MEGYIDENLTPKVENVYIVGFDRNILLETVLDTGFNDSFILPRKYLTECELLYEGKEEYLLADGQIKEEDVYRGQIIIDGIMIPVKLSLTDDYEALIGTRLLDRKIVTLNFKDYKITVEEE